LEESDRAILLTDDGRIDVHELLSSYLRRSRADAHARLGRGGRILKEAN
jgi:hypothetical protein